MEQKTSVLGFALHAFGACLVLSAACGGGSGAPAASPESASNGAASDSPPAAGDSAASAGAAPADAASKDAAPSAGGDSAKPAAEQPLLALCEEGCKKIKARCSETAFENCKMNCAQYDHPPPGCEGEARQALECARDAEDVPCVNIAPEICTKKFQRVVACMSGKTIEAKDDGPRTPDGWERFAAKSAGFSAMAPKGMTQSGEGFSVKAGEVEYLIRIVPAPKEKPTQKNLVQVAMGVLGKCSQKLKLRGMVDRPDKVFIRFDSACPDGVTWNGAFLITGGKMYMPYVATPKGSKSKPEIVDAFIFGFEVGGN